MASNDWSFNTPVASRNSASFAAADHSVCPPLGPSAAIQRRNRDSAAPSRTLASRWPAISRAFFIAFATTVGSRSGSATPPPASTASKIAATDSAGSIATRRPANPRSASAKAARSCTRTALPRCWRTASVIFSGATYRSAVPSTPTTR